MPEGTTTTLQDIMDQAMWDEWERSSKRGRKGTTTQLRSPWLRGEAEAEQRSPWSRIPEEEPGAGPPAIGAEMREPMPMPARATRGGGAGPPPAAPAPEEEMPLPGELPPPEEEVRRGGTVRGVTPRELPRATRNMLYRAGYSDQDIIDLSRQSAGEAARLAGREYYTVSGSTLDQVVTFLQQRERAQPKGPWQHPVERRFQQGPGLRVP